MSDNSNSASPASSSDSSMFPSANVPTSPPASQTPATAPLNTLSPPESSDTLPSHLRNSTATSTSIAAEAGSSALPSSFETAAPSATVSQIQDQDQDQMDISPRDDAPISSRIPTAATITAGGAGAGTTGSGVSSTPGVASLLAPSAEEDESAPGYMWRNRRAVEEMQKARDGCLDREFNLREFGDPFLDQYNAEKSAGQIK